jgi:predicted neuraminidase
MKHFVILLSSCYLVLVTFYAQAQTTVTPPFASGFDGLLRATASGAEEAYLPAIEHSSHAANLLLLKNGDLLCFWFSGEWEGKSGVAIVVSRLSAGSRQWSQPVVIDRQDGASFQNPVPFEAPDGDIWVIHTTQPAEEGEKNAKVLVVKSHDRGKTWSSPRILFDKPGAYVRNPIIVRPDGAWLLPMYITPGEGITTNAQTSSSVVELSKDNGKTWSECSIPNSYGYIQPSIVAQSKSSYIAFFRSRFADSIFRSASVDGCAWSAPKATSLPNNGSSIQAVGLKDGRIALAFNNTRAVIVDGKPATGPRRPLTVALSSDGGETWSAFRNIEVGQPVIAGDPSNAKPMKKEPGREEYSYPSILQMRDGKIVVAYTFRRQTIKVVMFPESWIEESSLPNR